MNGTVNKVILIGNLGDEVKTHYFSETNVVGKFSIATSETYTNKSGEKINETQWHNIVVKNNFAQICEKHLRKGDKVYIEGKIRTRKWMDDYGKSHSITQIVAENIQFLTPKREE